jgi:hypothetical protein
MDASHELASAIQEVAGQRHAVMATLQLDPNVFDSWLKGAAVDDGAAETPLRSNSARIAARRSGVARTRPGTSVLSKVGAGAGDSAATDASAVVVDAIAPEPMTSTPPSTSGAWSDAYASPAEAHKRSGKGRFFIGRISLTNV